MSAKPHIFFPKRSQLMAANSYTIPPLMGRTALMAAAGIDPPERDLNKDCGWPTTPTITTYDELYRREGIAKRVVDIYPDECWSVPPEVYETEDGEETGWEREWTELEERLNLYYELHRLSRRARLGEFGGMLLGFNDLTGNETLAKPVPGIDLRTGDREAGATVRNKLVFVRPLSQVQIKVKEVESDLSSPRLGQPRTYSVRFVDPRADGVTAEVVGADPSGTNLTDYHDVHWTRIHHLADNCEDGGNVFGQPALEPVLNRVLDLRKTLGSSAEAWWNVGFPAFAFEAYPDVVREGDELDKESVRDDMELFRNRLQRFLATEGGTWKLLAPTLADPTPFITAQYQSIASTIGTPLRILLGSEAGHLASGQDAVTWKARVAHKQRFQETPRNVKPFVRRLVAAGALSAPKRLYVYWPDLNTLTDKDRAEVAVKLAQTVLQYVTSGSEVFLPPKPFLTMVMGLTSAEADAVIKLAKQLAAQGDKAYLTKDVWDQEKALEAGAEGNPAGKTGASGRRNSQAR